MRTAPVARLAVLVALALPLVACGERPPTTPDTGPPPLRDAGSGDGDRR